MRSFFTKVGKPSSGPTSSCSPPAATSRHTSRVCQPVLVVALRVVVVVVGRRPVEERRHATTKPRRLLVEPLASGEVAPADPSLRLRAPLVVVGRERLHDLGDDGDVVVVFGLKLDVGVALLVRVQRDERDLVVTPLGVALVRHVLLHRVAAGLRVGERTAHQHAQVLLGARGPQLEDRVAAVDEAALAVVHAVALDGGNEHAVVEAAPGQRHAHPAERLDHLVLRARPHSPAGSEAAATFRLWSGRCVLYFSRSPTSSSTTGWRDSSLAERRTSS